MFDLMGWLSRNETTLLIAITLIVFVINSAPRVIKRFKQATHDSRRYSNIKHAPNDSNWDGWSIDPNCPKFKCSDCYHSSDNGCGLDLAQPKKHNSDRKGK